MVRAVVCNSDMSANIRYPGHCVNGLAEVPASKRSACGRSVCRPDAAGKRALFDYLEEYEELTREKVELNTIVLCSEYTEYDNLEELQGEYDNIKNMEELRNNTTVIPIEGKDSFIRANY